MELLFVVIVGGVFGGVFIYGEKPFLSDPCPVCLFLSFFSPTFLLTFLPTEETKKEKRSLSTSF